MVFGEELDIFPSADFPYTGVGTRNINLILQESFGMVIDCSEFKLNYEYVYWQKLKKILFSKFKL